MSAIVFIPHRFYIIKDTLKIPKNSRIIGQAWSQIMAAGPKFQDANNPHEAVQVGNVGDIGIMEIQDLLFTVRGPTAGAVLMEWNIHELTQGSAGLWDSHFRVGGALGSSLKFAQCLKQGGTVNVRCIAASLMLRLTRTSSAYLENVWVWTADHDLDRTTQDQIDVYSARGILVESQGPTWLYGTSSEHQVSYQYSLYEAKNILLGMIQTESPYFQPAPPAPQPFAAGLFPGDPDFTDCATSSATCPLSWAMQIIDSSSIYLLGAGFYSWFSDYSQKCLETESCQDRAFRIEESYNIWIANVVTKAIKEMYPQEWVPFVFAGVDPRIKYSHWGRNFPGYHIWDPEEDADALKGLPSACQTSLTQLVKCDTYTQAFFRESYRGSLQNDTLTDSVCDEGCGASLKSWFDNVAKNCAGHNVSSSVATKYGGQIWSGWNETCITDPTTGEYCNDKIEGFTEVNFTEELPEKELCSFCFIKRLEMMQQSSYSVYDTSFQNDLEIVYAQCGFSGSTDAPPSLDAPPELLPDSICVSGNTHTTIQGDTCDSIALKYSVSSAALVMANGRLPIKCSNLAADMDLCLPESCVSVYSIQNSSETCVSIETTTEAYGHVLCYDVQGASFTATAPVPGVTLSLGTNTGYSTVIVGPPTDAPVADGTTLYCGKWHVAVADETCVEICMKESITSALFLEVNLSLGTAAECSDALAQGSAYCVAPHRSWNDTDGDYPSSSTAIPTAA